MDRIRVGSFNALDNKINRNGGLRLDGESNALRFAHTVYCNDFDFLGTQELTIKYITEIQKYLQDYKFYGSHRYGKGILTKIPYNETNSIITNKEIIGTKTFGLPKAKKRSEVMMLLKGNIMPRRIATVVVSKQESYGTLCVINTHLDYETPSLQIRQLKEIKKLVLKYKEKYPVIVTGDFNMQMQDERFKDFVLDMSENGVERVQIDEATHRDTTGEAKTLDHIFLSTDFDVLDAGVIKVKNYAKTSDHNPIFADIKRR